jgi:hypothetical protein
LKSGGKVAMVCAVCQGERRTRASAVNFADGFGGQGSLVLGRSCG